MMNKQPMLPDPSVDRRLLDNLRQARLSFEEVDLQMEEVIAKFDERRNPLNTLAPAPDMDRTVSRRSEPSSRTALMGEQPNPWDVLPPQVATSRHRGAKPPRRCELLGEISLLSLE